MSTHREVAGVPQPLLDRATQLWQTLRDSPAAVRVAATVEPIWAAGYGAFFRDAYVDAATRIVAASEEVQDQAAWPLCAAIAMSATQLLGRSEELPLGSPPVTHELVEAAVMAAEAGFRPAQALAEEVWQATCRRGTVDGALALGAQLTGDAAVLAVRRVLSDRGVHIDGHPADVWYRRTLLAVNRAVILPAGVPVSAAELAAQGHVGTGRPAPADAITSAPEGRPHQPPTPPSPRRHR